MDTMCVLGTQSLGKPGLVATGSVRAGVCIMPAGALLGLWMPTCHIVLMLCCTVADHEHG
jgi:hypothetical protein